MTIDLEWAIGCDLGVSRSPRTRVRTGVVVALPKHGGAIIGVLFDGHKRVTRVHRSYIEPNGRLGEGKVKRGPWL